MVRTSSNKLSWVLVVLSAAALCQAGFAAGEGIPSPKPESGITVELSLPQKVLKGLPCLATVRVTARSSGPVRPPTRPPGVPADRSREALVKYLSAYPGFPEYDFLRGHPPLSVDIVDADSGEAARSIKPPTLSFLLADPAAIDPPLVLPLREAKLARGETRSFVVDSGPWFEDLADGKYAVGVDLHNRHKQKIARSNRIRTELASLPDEIFQAIRRSTPDFPARISPLQPRHWLVMRMNWRLLQDALPKEVFGQLALYSFLSDVAHEGEIENAQTDLLEDVPDHLKEFAAALRYEVLLAKGEGEAAKKLRDAVFSKSIGMKWRFDQADAGNGLLQQVIKRISPDARRQ